MDSHEKLGTLLSQYLSSEGPEFVPEDVLDAFHKFELTEFASRENIDTAYRKKIDEIEADLQTESPSRFSREFNKQQKKKFDEAYTLIISWLSNKS